MILPPTMTIPLPPSNDNSKDTAQPPKGVQWDVPLVDEYLYSLLVPTLQRVLCTATGKSTAPLSPRFLVALLSACTLYVTRGRTPAVQALRWRVVEIQPSLQQSQQSPSSSSRRPTIPSTPSKQSILLYILCSVVLPTLYQQLKDWYHEYLVHDAHPSPDSTNNHSSSLQELARQRQRQLFHFLLTWSHKVIALAQLLVWLSPFHHPPRLAMSLVGLQYARAPPSSSMSSTQQEDEERFAFHVAYGHRRWLYEELWRFGTLVAPVASWQEGQDLVTWILQPCIRVWQQVRPRIKELPSSRLLSNRMASCCPICQREPIIIPYQTNCGCPQRYCYACLWKDMYETIHNKNHYITSDDHSLDRTGHDPTFTCRACHQSFTSAHRCQQTLLSAASPLSVKTPTSA